MEVFVMMNTGMCRHVFRFTAITFYATALLSHAASAVEVAPYFYTWGLDNPVYKVSGLMDAKQKAGLNAATLAFVISNGTCKASTGVDDMLPDLKNFTSSGGRIIISFGGATGPYLEDACQNDDDLFNQIDGVIQRTGVYSLDFDVEGAYLGMPNINDRRTRVLIRLRAKYPQLILSYTLPVTPPRSQWDLGGLTNFGVELMQRTATAGLAIDVVNLMTMDYYFTVPGKTQGDLAIACAEQVVSQLKSIYPGKSQASLYAMVGITPMIGINDDAAVFTLDDTNQVTQFAVQKGIGRLAMWSFQRDQVGQGPLGIYSGVNKTNFEFYQALKLAEGVIIDPPPPSPTPTVTPTSSPTPKPTLTPSPTPTVNPTPTPTPPTDPGTCRIWAEDRAYQRGEVVMYQGQTYTALVAHTAYVGTNWNPAATPSLWQKGGTCGGPHPTPTSAPTPTPTLTPTPTPTMSPIPTPTPTNDPGTCQVWTEGRAYKRGEVVMYQGQAYTALVDHIAYVGTNWNPAGTPTLWQKGGVCNGVQPTPTPTLTPTPTPTQSPVPTPTPTPPDSNGYCAPNWNAGTVYHAGQIVGYLGKAYQAITDTWSTPPDSTIYKNWNLIGSINNDLCPVPIPNPINYGSPQVVGGNPHAGVNPTSPVSIAHPVTGDSTEPAGKLGAVNPAQDRGGNHPGFNADTGGRVAKLPPGTLPPQHNTYQINSGKELVAYIGDWAVYGRQFDFRTIPAENLSRIVYGFAGICYPTADG